MDFNDPKLGKVLGIVGQAVGADPRKLEQDLRAGRFDAVFQKLNARDAARLRQVLENPALAQQILKTPQAKQTLRDILNQTEKKR